MGIIRLLSKNGDDETVWNDKESAKIAENLFKDLLKSGHAAFEKKENGTHEQVKNFNHEAEEILIVKNLVGG